jgi:hypothetical protein
MATSISDLPDDIDEFEVDPGPAPVISNRRSKKGKYTFVTRYKDSLYVFIAVLAASYIPLENFQYRLPEQVFVLGDAPIRALLATVIFMLIKVFL